MISVLILIYLSLSLPDCFCKQYRVILNSVDICKDPQRPYANPLPFNLTLKVYNNSKGNTVLRGNVVVEKDLAAENKSAAFAVGTETAAGITWKWKMMGMDCYSSILRSILGTVGVPLKRCLIKKGNYAIRDVDVDAIDSKLVAALSRNMGRYLVKLEAYSNINSLLCLDIRVTVQPLKKQRGIPV